MSIYAVSWAFKQKVDDPIGKLVLIAIADRYNDEKGYAWPSVKWLADVADCTDRTARTKINRLVELGFIRRNIRFNDTSTYEILFKEAGGENPSGGKQLLQGGGETSFQGGGETRLPPNNKEQESNNNISASFAAFWEVVPRKVGKKAAARAYKAALKETSADILLERMKDYSAKCSKAATASQYIAHASTWLQQGRWDDEDMVEPDITAVVNGRDSSRKYAVDRWDTFTESMKQRYRYDRPDVMQELRKLGKE